MAVVDQITPFAWAPTGSSGPDSITLDNGTAWVAYTNGADSTGLFGHSTIVQYSASGAELHRYNLAGYVDGLKLDPYTGQMWALQNQDGNSTLTTIDPVTHVVDGPFHYAVRSSAQGYDDVVFRGGQVFLSYTNPPGTSGDPTLVRLLDPTNLTTPLKTRTILTDGTLGLDTVTGRMEIAPQTDPDSLKLAPNGDLIFSSGNDGDILAIEHPGAPGQTMKFTPIRGVTPGNAGLDDVILPSATSGTFYIADTKNNRVLKVHMTGLNLNDYYASVGSLNAFGQVDPSTGVFTPLVSSANAPGFSFGSPHGVEFVPDAPASATSFAQHAASFAPASAASVASGLSLAEATHHPMASLGLSRPAA